MLYHPVFPLNFELSPLNLPFLTTYDYILTTSVFGLPTSNQLLTTNLKPKTKGRIIQFFPLNFELFSLNFFLLRLTTIY